ncbi:hypothetical protein OC844_002538 [Tilletia horrida]|nr:hypothetical protein OC844_002538 [Tilletia horrida]
MTTEDELTKEATAAQTAGDSTQKPSGGELMRDAARAQSEVVSAKKALTEDEIKREIAATEAALDSSKPTIPHLAANHLPIVIPWHPEEVIYPGQLFHSELFQSPEPWSKTSPFIKPEEEDAAVEEGRLRSQLLFLSADGGTSGTFRSTKTEGSVVKENHESYGFTASVNLAICTASASLQYDKHLSQNDDDVKTSSRASYRCGTVILRQPPALTTEAKLELKYGGGIEGFERKYGDYYLFGYNLGADNMMLVSTNTASSSMKERKTLSAKASFFLFDISYTQHFDSASASASAALSVSGYDTLEHTNINTASAWASAATTEFDGVIQQGAKMRSMGSQLATRVEDKVAELGLLMGSAATAETVMRLVESGALPAMDCIGRPSAHVERPITKEVCERLVKSNLVVELVLRPVRTLREVQYWMHEDDII